MQKTNAKNNTPVVNQTTEKPKIVTIVKPVQKPTSSNCNVKRSKSLRLLSSSGKLSFNESMVSGKQPEPLSVRTLSLESIVDEGTSEMMKQAKSSSHIEKIHSSSPYDFEILHKFKYLVSGLGKYLKHDHARFASVSACKTTWRTQNLYFQVRIKKCTLRWIRGTRAVSFNSWYFLSD